MLYVRYTRLSTTWTFEGIVLEPRPFSMDLNCQLILTASESYDGELQGKRASPSRYSSQSRCSPCDSIRPPSRGCGGQGFEKLLAGTGSGKRFLGESPTEWPISSGYWPYTGGAGLLTGQLRVLAATHSVGTLSWPASTQRLYFRGQESNVSRSAKTIYITWSALLEVVFQLLLSPHRRDIFGSGSCQKTAATRSLRWHQSISACSCSFRSSNSQSAARSLALVLWYSPRSTGSANYFMFLHVFLRIWASNKHRINLLVSVSSC